MFKLPFSIISSNKLKELKEAVKTYSQKISEIDELLEKQRGLAGAVLGSMAEGVLAVDSGGKMTLVNPAIEKMFGVTEPEIIGKTAREGLRNNEVADIIEEVLKKGQLIQKEIDIVTPFQGYFIALASPIGSREGVVCVLHDITELRKLESYRSEFVANVSHELKTPLTAIRNYVETLIGGAVNDKERNLEFLNKIDKHAINLSALIDDILEISRLESRKELGPYVKVDLAKVMSRALDTVQGKMKKKKIVLEKRCETDQHTVLGIEDHIYRAILNLVDNAVNYTPEGGRIEVSCSKQDDKITILVSDTGIGIPKEHLPRIFERFYRVDKARSRELGGTGLGLAIVKHVMNIHNGSVSVESEEGKSAKFSLIFPVYAGLD